MFKDEEKLVKLLVLIGGIILLFIFLIPWIMTREIFDISYMETGQIGDTFGGITAPFIGGISVLFTFSAFYIQYQANIEQKKSLKQQEKDLKVERFENKFFELINIHRDNVRNTKINSYYSEIELLSNKAFKTLFDEFRICYHLVYGEYIKAEKDLMDEEVVNIAYILFYIGIGTISELSLKELLKNYDINFIELILKKFKDKKEEYNSTKNMDKKILSIEKISGKKGNLPELETKFYYQPFEGHIDTLGNYFRHLWNTVEFFEENAKKLKFSEEEKIRFMKILRSQISSYEQLLLHYNSFTNLGKIWRESGLIKKYGLVKNLPYPMAYFGPDIKEYGKNYFEWDKMLKTDNK